MRIPSAGRGGHTFAVRSPAADIQAPPFRQGTRARPRPFVLLALILAGLQAGFFAHAAGIERHPLEQQALANPDQVLAEIGRLESRAVAAKDFHTLALLELARANACRVKADWACLQRAGQAAYDNALQARMPDLQVRALVQLSLASQYHGDYHGANELLEQALQGLTAQSAPEVGAEVYLSLSSINNRLGQRLRAIAFARQGLAELPPGVGDSQRCRLLRNLATGSRMNDEPTAAAAYLAQAMQLATRLGDPKLMGDLWVESAAQAGLRGDYGQQIVTAGHVLEYAHRFGNASLRGSAEENLAEAARGQGRPADAQQHLLAAEAAFGQVGAIADQLRVQRQLLQTDAQSGQGDAWRRRLLAYLQLSESLSQRERAAVGESYQRLLEEEARRQRLRQSLLETRRAHALADERLLRERIAWAALFAVGVLLGLLAWQYQQLRRANALLATATEARFNALMRTSHEIRNPINGILGLCELLRRSALDESQRELLQGLSGAAESLQALAQDLLDQGRLEQGQLRLNPEPHSLRDLLESLQILFAPRAEEAGLSLRCQVAPGVADQIWVDSLRLRQVLTNLLSNALKFVHQGGVQVSVRQSERPAAEGYARLRFSVRDTGPGIAENDQKRLFEPFVRGLSGQRLSGGIGLGLSISRDLVALMGGTLELESRLGEGSSFAFELELLLADSVDETVGALAESGLFREASLRALVIDDDPVNRLLLETQLSSLGFRVDVFATGMEAVRAVESTEYSIVLIDYELPDIRGDALVRQLRDLAAGRMSTRFMVVSGHLPPSRLELLGIDAWLVKPVSLERLAAVLPQQSQRPDSRINL